MKLYCSLQNSLFTRLAGSSLNTILVYVDDVIITSKDDLSVNNLKLVLDQNLNSRIMAI